MAKTNYSKSGVKEIVIALVLVGIILGSIFGYYTYKKMPVPISEGPEPKHLKTFVTLDELKTFLKAASQRQYRGGFGDLLIKTLATSAPMAEASSDSSGSSGGQSYSTTNVQVEGVDEADIVKSDGKYIYVVSGSNVSIIDAFPADKAKILSTININGGVNEIFINKDKLILFGWENQAIEEPQPSTGMASEMIMRPGHYPTYQQTSFVKIYDLSDRSNPVLERNILSDGSYFNSRMIGDYVYVIVNKDTYYYDGGDPVLPLIRDGNKEIKADIKEVSYFDLPFSYYRFTTILSINTQEKTKDVENKIFLTGGSDNLYVSEGNIYIAETVYGYDVVPLDPIVQIIDPVVQAVDSLVGSHVSECGLSSECLSSKISKCGVGTKCFVPPVQRPEKTIIHRISINKGEIKYQYQGDVPGHLSGNIPQFSMDEHKGFFRIATTIGEISQTDKSSSNNVYVLNDKLEVVGKVEGLAQGEKIYSTRFMGDKGYVVTFKKVDPLFVFDLSDPTNPKVLGQLKIPGYSDYLHPYSENLIIGVGKDTVEAEETGRDFAWYQGVKLALFDVSDPTKPKEIAKFNIGSRGTESPVLDDHKAFLFDKEKNLLVIPVSVSEIDAEKYPNGLPADTYGDHVFQGAYVFTLTPEKGFELKGKVTHLEDTSVLEKDSYYWGNYGTDVKRSMYIDNVLYTLSDKYLQMNDLQNPDTQINKIQLPFEERYYGWIE